MLTLKLKINKSSDIEQINNFIYGYTGLFYKLYNNPELLYDQTFIKENLNEYIDRSTYQCCIKDVLVSLKHHQTSKDKKVKQQKEISKLLERNNFNTTKEKRFKYKLIKKLAYLNRTINNDIVFGGKVLLQEITKLSQNKSNDILLQKKKQLFKEKRSLGYYFIGNTCEYGNRKFNFDFTNQRVIFKPNRKNSIILDLKINKSQQRTLNIIQGLIENKLIPITVRLSSKFISITYDETLLNGYKFDKISCSKEQKLVHTKEEKKEIYIKHIEELNSKKKIGKLEQRYIAIDLNPNYIGCSIFDKVGGEQKIIKTLCFDLTKLNNKRNLNSSDKKQKYQNNKRKYEISIIWKYIFGMVNHYKIYNIVIEDLNFNSIEPKGSNEFNRQTKNLWHRTLTENLITKYCNIYGTNLLKVNPCYTSFIGNMIHDYPDPIASSLEIGRRGMSQYIKGYSIYPDISRINQEKLNYLLGENMEYKGWKELYKIISCLRYRNPIPMGLKDKYLYSYKSKVRL